MLCSLGLPLGWAGTAPELCTLGRRAEAARLCSADTLLNSNHPIHHRKEDLALCFSMCVYIICVTYLISGRAESSLLRAF